MTAIITGVASRAKLLNWGTIGGNLNPRHLMQRFPVQFILILWGAAALAQQPVPAPGSPSPSDQTPSTSRNPSTSAPLVQPSSDEEKDRQPPLTPLEEREKQIRQVDPLARDEDQTGDENAAEEQPPPDSSRRRA
jgi:hypothetical protein